MIAGYKSVLDLIGQLCSGSRHRALGVSFICLEMVLRRRRLYDLVIDPAVNVDLTRDSSRISGIEDYRSWQQLLTAHVWATQWRWQCEQHPLPTIQWKS